MNDYSILIGIGCFFAGLLIAYWVKGRIMTQKIKAAESEAARGSVYRRFQEKGGNTP
jgi:hypothetical protein